MSSRGDALDGVSYNMNGSDRYDERRDLVGEQMPERLITQVRCVIRGRVAPGQRIRGKQRSSIPNRTATTTLGHTVAMTTPSDP
jgi:hypothetical protein